MFQARTHIITFSNDLELFILSIIVFAIDVCSFVVGELFEKLSGLREDDAPNHS